MYQSKQDTHNNRYLDNKIAIKNTMSCSIDFTAAVREERDNDAISIQRVVRGFLARRRRYPGDCFVRDGQLMRIDFDGVEHCVMSVEELNYGPTPYLFEHAYAAAIRIQSMVRGYLAVALSTKSFILPNNSNVGARGKVLLNR